MPKSGQKYLTLDVMDKFLQTHCDLKDRPTVTWRKGPDASIPSISKKPYLGVDSSLNFSTTP